MVGIVAGTLLIASPVPQLLFAYGARNLCSWAWYLGLIASGLTVLGVIIHLIQGA